MRGGEAMSKRRDIASKGDAILKAAGCDTMSGAKKDGKYRRDRRAERKIYARHARKKERKLCRIGRASQVKRVFES
jgi:hypothetical protein